MVLLDRKFLISRLFGSFFLLALWIVLPLPSRLRICVRSQPLLVLFSVHDEWFSSCCFKTVLAFWSFQHHGSLCGSLHVQSTWWLLSFSNLQIKAFHQIGEFMVIISSINIFPLCFSIPPGTITSTLIGLTLSYRSLSCQFSSILFSLYSLDQIMSIDLSSSTLVVFFCLFKCSTAPSFLFSNCTFQTQNFYFVSFLQILSLFRFPIF